LGGIFVFPTEIQLPSFAILLEKISKLLISQNCQKKKKTKNKKTLMGEQVFFLNFVM
jgi:hypothetical protein